MLNGKVMITNSVVGLIKKIYLNKMSYFPEPYTPSKNKRKGGSDLSNYGTKSDLKGATGIDTSKTAKEVDLVNLKSNINKLNIDKSETITANLKKISRK